jgi:thioredoxin-like negative regulator of GroEL
MKTEIKSLKEYYNITNIDFGETVVFIKFGAEWCKPCKNLENEINKLYKCILYEVDIDNDEFEDIKQDNNIFSIPDTFVKYKNKTSRFTGFKTVEQLGEIINEITRA